MQGQRRGGENTSPEARLGVGAGAGARTSVGVEVGRNKGVSRDRIGG